MAREMYDVSIICPNCGQSGELMVSENDYPFMKRLARDIKCAEGEFQASMVNDKNAKISCKKCKQEFTWPSPRCDKAID